MLGNIEASIKNKLGNFNDSAKNVKELSDSVKEINFDTEKTNEIFDLVDQRINKVAKELRSEIAEERKLMIRHRKKLLMIKLLSQ
jgi:uncharacterized protein YoxC